MGFSVRSPRDATPDRPSSWRSHRTVAALTSAMVLWSVVALTDKLFGLPASPPPSLKGTVLKYTIRAPTDIAWSEYAGGTGRERGFVPIYERNEDLFAERRAAIILELNNLEPDFWATFGASGPAGVARGSRETREYGVAKGADVDGLDGPDTMEPRPSLRDRIADRFMERTGRVTEWNDGGVETASDAERMARELLTVLAPLFVEGVVADDEFPALEKEIRIFTPYEKEREKDKRPTLPRPREQVLRGGKYAQSSPSRLHRFSELERVGTQVLYTYFPQLAEPLGTAVLGFVLDRLPPNLRYSATNREHIRDRSLVTGEQTRLARRGQVLAKRGQMVDTETEAGLRAAMSAKPRRVSLLVAQGALLVCVFLLGSAGLALADPRLATASKQFGILLGLCAVVSVGRLAMAFSSLSELIVPLAWVPTLVTYRRGIHSALVAAGLAAALGAVCLAFDASSFSVFLAGAATGCVVVRPSSRRSLWLAAIAVPLLQVAMYIASVAMGAPGRTLASWAVGAQAVFGGVLAVAGAAANLGLSRLYMNWRARWSVNIASGSAKVVKVEGEPGSASEQDPAHHVEA